VRHLPFPQPRLLRLVACGLANTKSFPNIRLQTEDIRECLRFARGYRNGTRMHAVKDEKNSGAGS